MTLKLLNVGCGNNFHLDWVNIDLVSNSPHVIQHDILQGLPFENKSFDAVYCSHVLEHLDPQCVESFLIEAVRILKPKGVLRIVVPDLERITRQYLTLLERVNDCDTAAEADYDWIMLELYDQTVRSFSGGQMGIYLSNPNVPNKDFIISRIGTEANIFFEYSNSTPNKFGTRFKGKRLSQLAARASHIIRENILLSFAYILGGIKWKQAVREGLFRSSGEIHRWMYDKYSLKRLMENVGLKNVAVYAADRSQISGFNQYSLDYVEGNVRKPDSLFMEGIKV